MQIYLPHAHNRPLHSLRMYAVLSILGAFLSTYGPTPCGAASAPPHMHGSLTLMHINTHQIFSSDAQQVQLFPTRAGQHKPPCRAQPSLLHAPGTHSSSATLSTDAAISAPLTC